MERISLFTFFQKTLEIQEEINSIDLAKFMKDVLLERKISLTDFLVKSSLDNFYFDYQDGVIVVDSK